MYEDVPISNMPNKVRLIELVNENVIPPLNTKFKGHLLMAFFFVSSKIQKCQKDIVVNLSKIQV